MKLELEAEVCARNQSSRDWTLITAVSGLPLFLVRSPRRPQIFGHVKSPTDRSNVKYYDHFPIFRLTLEEAMTASTTPETKTRRSSHCLAGRSKAV